MKQQITLFQRLKSLLIIIGLQIGAYCFAMFQGGFVSWFICYTVTPFLLYALIVRLVPQKIIAHERLLEPKRAYAGDNIIVTLRITRSDHFPLAYIRLEELVGQRQLIKHVDMVTPALRLGGFRKQYEWQYVLVALPRGAYDFTGTRLVGSDFVGLAHKEMLYQQAQRFLVYPKTQPIKYYPIHRTFDIGNASVARAAQQDTTMAVGVRDYEDGDRMSWIDWKSFARNQQLRTKEFEERQSDITAIVLDTRHTKHFEAAVVLAASLIKAIHAKRDTLTFAMLNDATRLYTIQKPQQFDEVLSALAIVQPTEQLQQWQLPQQLGQVPTLLFITVAVNDEDIKRMAMRARAVICIVLTQDKRNPYKKENVTIYYAKPNDYYNILAEVSRL